MAGVGEELSLPGALLCFKCLNVFGNEDVSALSTSTGQGMDAGTEREEK